MKNFLSLLAVLLFSCDDSTSIHINGNSNPNILLIIADDFGKDACIGYSEGIEKPKLPNLQKLIDKGIIFDNFHVNPVCSPTRATILTGKHSFRTGVLNAEEFGTLSTDEITLHRTLSENTEYANSIIGKWHLGNSVGTPEQMGVEYYAGLFSGGVQDYWSWRLVENASNSQTDEYITTKLTDLAINWINSQDSPWFCWLAYNVPHKPFHLPPLEMHSKGALSEDESIIEASPLPYYMAMVESLDFEIGRLLDSINDPDLENTIVIVMGDNGTPGQVSQEPYTSSTSKGSLYKGGINVPLIIAGKGVTRLNQRDNNLINSVDLFPTISTLAGHSLDSYEDGYSFFDLLTNDGNFQR